MLQQTQDSLSNQLHQLAANQQQYNSNYYYEINSINRRLFFAHDMLQMFKIKSKITQYDNSTIKKNLQIQDVPNIRYQDSSAYLGNMFQKIIGQNVKHNQVNYTDIYMAYFLMFKSEFLLTFFMFLFQTLTRIAVSVLLYYLFIYVGQGDLIKSYIFGALAGFLLMIGSISRHNGMQECSLITTRMKSAIIFVIFKKLCLLSQYTIKSAQLGKITNLLSNDFNVIELKGPIFLLGLTSPIGIIGICILLVTRVGWTGLICFVVPILLLPIQTIVSKMNGSIQQKINVDKDSRVKLTSQIIEGIKFVKLYGWQIAFKNVIQTLRQKQVHNLMFVGFGRSIERTLGNCSSFIGSYVCFIITYYIQPQALSTVKILSILQLMIYLRILLFLLGLCIGFIFQINVTFKRIANILNIKNQQSIQIGPFTKRPVSQISQNCDVNVTINQLLDVTINVNSTIQEPTEEDLLTNGQIRLYNFNGYWNVKNLQVPSLKGLNLFFEKETLYGIGGKVGSGKSGLLGALLGQIPYYSGLMQVSGSISYVEQQPIIFSNTIRQNILFGKEMNESDYNATLDASCLKSDLKILENGDMTIVGERGMTLSGGQKARLCLARALYADSDIYLLDDPLSAVDSKVAKVIFETAIKTLLKFKTVILVTHQINYLEQCDKVVILQNGCIKKFDKPQKMKQQLQQLMSEFKQKQQEQQQYEEQQEQQKELRQSNILLKAEQNRQRRKTSIDTKSISQYNVKISQVKKESQVEVKLSSYPKYIFYSKTNYFLFPVTLACFFAAQGCYMTYYRFISTYDKQLKGQNATFKDMNQFWMVLGLILFGYIALNILKNGLLYTSNLYSNQKIHQDMIRAMVRSPSYFFDITPSGQLISKFSNDIGILDSILSFTLIDSLEGPIISGILLANIFQINYLFTIVGLITVVVFVIMLLYCKQPIIESKQLDLRLKSPMFNQLSQMMNGIIPINIYKQRFYFLKQFSKRVNNSSRGNICFYLLSRAFGANLGLFSNIVLIIGFLIGIYNSTPQTAGLYMVSVVFLIQINDFIHWFLRQIINMESIMVSVQRAFQITSLKSEAQLHTQYDKEIGIIDQQQKSETVNQQIGQLWPKKPNFKIRNMTMKYREQLPLVLKGLNFDIEQYQKVGIVGRTGAGKSSIVQALLRISEPSQQSTYQIDGCNVLKMGLSSLRHNISVIPQTPFLFKGSIKLNLDPFETKSDSQLWNVLQEAGLKDYVEKLPKQLDTDVSNTSEVFSVGQKQLLCLARALVRNSKILFLDEATSNVDMKTDEFIQNVLKSKFTNTTIIAIAHRLNTIADYDKVIVLSRGRVKQSGSPHELIQKRGLFYEMVSHTGNNAENIIKIAKQTYQKKIRKLRKRNTL